MIEEVTCLVCADPAPPLYRVCNCNTLLHEKCFEGVVASVPSHASGCPVCLRQYRTVRTDHTKRSRVASALLLAVSAFTWFAAILTKMSFFMFISACAVFISFSIPHTRDVRIHVLGASHQMP